MITEKENKNVVSPSTMVRKARKNTRFIRLKISLRTIENCDIMHVTL